MILHICASYQSLKKSLVKHGFLLWGRVQCCRHPLLPAIPSPAASWSRCPSPSISGDKQGQHTKHVGLYGNHQMVILELSETDTCSCESRETTAKEIDGQSWKHVCEQHHTDWAGNVYVYIHTYAYICVCIHDVLLHTVLCTHTYMHVMPIQDKEVMNWKESKEGLMGGFGRSKGKNIMI